MQEHIGMYALYKSILMIDPSPGALEPSLKTHTNGVKYN